MRIAHALQNFVESDCLPKSVPLALLLLINTPKQLEALANENFSSHPKIKIQEKFATSIPEYTELY